MTNTYKTNLGTKIYLGSADDTPTYAEIKRLRGVPGLQLSQERIEVTHNGSSNREYIKSGLSDPNEYSFQMETNRSDAVHQTLFELRDTDTIRPFKIVYPDGLAWKFDACVMSITRADYDAQSPDVIIDTVALAISGDIEDISDSLLS